MAPKTPLEIPVFTAAAALQAQSLGAQRIELNAPGSYPLGGTTPTMADLEAISAVDVPAMIMIRPRGPPKDGTDFIYSDKEFDTMKASIEEFVESGYLEAGDGDGFVFGVLRKGENGVEVDIERNTALVEAAAGHPCTFHRAFDELLVGSGEGSLEADAARAVEDVASCGFTALLTSGGPGKAPENVAALAAVREKARGRLELIVGGGVRSGNVARIVGTLGPEEGGLWAHSSCLAAGEENLDVAEVGGLLSQL
ncbi:copper homeostasis protein cutC [Plectosphaerella plurivora]|uniref:Copper homeostasis protein cutC homolog n=1 Tax=Plectosphaerella plurivora TaxID=936078 RepID=A0A9P8VBR2_9PEZI|nr:copper homeostasis protein cutC [Plectosphaerella plurivora]